MVDLRFKIIFFHSSNVLKIELDGSIELWTSTAYCFVYLNGLIAVLPRFKQSKAVEP
jgi:hypothetical protein